MDWNRSDTHSIVSILSGLPAIWNFNLQKVAFLFDVGNQFVTSQ